jgi:hypothetical protein
MLSTLSPPSQLLLRSEVYAARCVRVRKAKEMGQLEGGRAWFEMKGMPQMATGDRSLSL